MVGGLDTSQVGAALPPVGQFGAGPRLGDGQPVAFGGAPVLSPAPAPGPLPKPGQFGLLNVKSLADLEAEDRAKAAAVNARQEVIGLAAHLRQLWEAAKRAKVPHELKMLEDLRQRDGQYDPDEAELIKQQGGSDIYMMLTATKCRAAAAWIKSMLLPADDRPWAIEPTPNPSLPPDVEAEIEGNLAAYRFITEQRLQMGVLPPEAETWESFEGHLAEIEEEVREKRRQALDEEATKRANGMTDRIEDQLQEGGYYTALAECIEDLVTFPAAIMHGPIVRRRKRLMWGQDPVSGAWTPELKDVLATEFERVSGFDIYPLPATTCIQTGGFFHRKKMTVDDLAAMIGVPGYHEASIRAAIDQYARGGLREWLNADAPRATAEGRPHEFLSQTDTIDCLSFWGRVPGKLLLDFGMSSEDVPDRSLSYEVNAWLVGSFVVRALLNPNPLAKRPYGMASYEKVPGSFWGKAPPRLGRDCQRMCNAAARSIANNMAIGSGPQVVVKDTSRLPAGESIEAIYPWKIWQLTGDKSGRGTDTPIDFFQPQTMVEQLLEVYGYFSRLFDDVVTIPASAYGSDQGAGAAKTASGQAMLENNAGRTMKGVIFNVDEGLIKVPVENLFIHEMLYGEDPDIKGDLVVKAKGAATLVVKEVAQMRRNDFLNIVLNSQVLQRIIGDDGVAAVAREVAGTLEMDKNVVPPEDELQQRLNPALVMMPPAGGQPRAGEPPQQDLSGTARAGGADARLV